MRNILLLVLLATLLVACNSQKPALGGVPELVNLEGRTAVAGEVLVKYSSRVSASSLQTLSGSGVLSSMSDEGFGTLARVSVPKGQELDYIEQYTHQAGVEYAEPNYWITIDRNEMKPMNFAMDGGVQPLALSGPVTDKFFVDIPPTDPFKFDGCAGVTNPQPGVNCFQYQNVPYLWGLSRIRAPEAWNAGITGKDVVVAVVDEGSDLTHPDLAPNLWVNPNPSSTTCPGTNGYDFANNDTDPTDTGGHGTHTAGTVLAAANNLGVVGVAPEAKLMTVKALGYQGGTTYMLARGLKYVADCGAKVSNNSWGGGGRTKAFEDVMRYGTGKGHVYVFSAGNSFREGNRISYPVGYSTVLSGVIGVGAVSPNNVRTGFSDAGNYVTVGAPGQAIMSSIPQEQGSYAFLQGTSMASPHVAGVVALLFQAKPNLTPTQVRVALERSANAVLTRQLAKPDYNTNNAGWYGYGMVDAKAAVDYVNANF